MLYLIPTPVGNMEDMTFRAIRLLKEADIVLCEYNRTSCIMLKQLIFLGIGLFCENFLYVH